MWVWLLVSPGMTTRPPASSFRAGACRSIAVIVSPRHSKRLHRQGSRPGPEQDDGVAQ